MAEAKFNAPGGLAVGKTPINSIDASNNATLLTLQVSGATTLAALAASSLIVSGRAGFSTIPTSPTPAVDNNSTQSATTAFFFNQKANAVPLMAGVAAIGNSTRWAAMNHIHPSDTSKLDVISPSATGTLTVAGGTITTVSPIFDGTQTWNNAGTAFSALRMVVTNTASASGSKLVDLTIGGNSFAVDRNCTTVQVLQTPNLARDVKGAAGSRHVREYQDLTDDGVQGLPGSPGVSTDSFEWGYTWNAKWDTTTSTYLKDRSNAGDHAIMMRTSKKFGQEWWWSDGTTAGSAISWINRVKFDMPAAAYTFSGTINATTLNVSGNIETGIWNATTISTSKGGTGLTVIGIANQFLGVNAGATGLEYKTITSSDSSLSIMYPSPGVIDIKLVGTIPGNVNFSGDLSVGGAAPNHKFLVLAASGNTDINGTLNVVGATTLSSTLSAVGDLTINTNKFVVAAATGNTAVAGTLTVSGATILSKTLVVSGSTTMSTTANVVGNFSVNTNKFVVTAASGNTSVAGTLGIAGAITASSTLAVTHDFTVNTNKFVVTAASGNTSVAGTLGVSGAVTLSNTLAVVGDFSVNTNKFNITAASGNTLIAGTLNVSGKTSVNEVSAGTLTLNDGSIDAASTTITSTAAATAGAWTIDTVPNTHKFAEFIITANVAGAGAYQCIKLLVACDGASTVSATEYGNVEIGNTGVSYDVSAVAGVISLVATTTLVNTTFKVVTTMIK